MELIGDDVFGFFLVCSLDFEGIYQGFLDIYLKVALS